MVKTLLHVHQGEQDSYNDSLHTDTSWKTGGSLLMGTSGLYGCGRVGWGEEREVQQMWDHCLCAVHIPENLGSNNPCDIRNHISEHHWLTEHKVDWDSVECVTFRTNYQRLTLESWYTNSEQEPLNWCQQLPATHTWPQTKPTHLNKQ